MLRRLSPRWLIPLTVVVLLLPSCSDSSDDGAATTVPTATAQAATTSMVSTTVPATTTTADQATTTSSPSHDDVVVTKDIVYLEMDGNEYLVDVYVPAGDGPWPVVVALHGGTVYKNNSYTTRVAKAAAEAVARYQGGPPIRDAYQRIAERRGNKVARVAAARKLLTLVFYGIRDGEIRCLQHEAAA